MTLLDISTGWKTAIMFTAMMVVFYFFMIRPQSLKAGDRIMTAGGLHATIVSTDATQAVLEIAPGTRIKVAKTNIQPIPERKKK